MIISLFSVTHARAREVVSCAAVLLCCSAAEAQAGVCRGIPLNAMISPVGAFSNVRYTSEHAYGYTILLWRAGKCVFGLFESSAGLAGDTPIGEIQDVKYDEKTATLSFTAKLSTGLISSGSSQGFEPSRDLFRFNGHLRAAHLTGIVGYTNQNHRDFRATYQRIALSPSIEEVELMRNSATYGEWREKWQPVLRSRGPRW